MHLATAGQARVWNKRFGDAPDSALYVGRPSKWGNPFAVTKWRSKSRAVQEYVDWLLFMDGDAEELRQSLMDGELSGQELVCWCVERAGVGVCHAKVLARVQAQFETPGWTLADVRAYWLHKLARIGYWA